MSERNPDSGDWKHVPNKQHCYTTGINTMGPGVEKYRAAMEKVLAATGLALDAYHAQRASEPWWKRRWFTKGVQSRAFAVYMRTMAEQREAIDPPRRARG